MSWCQLIRLDGTRRDTWNDAVLDVVRIIDFVSRVGEWSDLALDKNAVNVAMRLICCHLVPNGRRRFRSGSAAMSSLSRNAAQRVCSLILKT